VSTKKNDTRLSRRISRKQEKSFIKKLMNNIFGQALVEMVLIIPLFLLLTFSIFDFGIMLGKQHSINHMAKELSRAASIGFTQDELKNLSINLSSTIMNVESHVIENNSGNTIMRLKKTGESDIVETFEPALANRKKGDHIKVKVEYTYKPFTPFFNFFSVPLTGESIARVEYMP
jgi:Flp pilus assembly protein TadG